MEWTERAEIAELEYTASDDSVDAIARAVADLLIVDAIKQYERKTKS